MRSWDFLWSGPEPPCDEHWYRCVAISKYQLSGNRTKAHKRLVGLGGR